MHVCYLLGSTANPLYGGKHALAGRFHTYGQHAFILDFVTALSRRGDDVHVMVHGLDTLPIARALAAVGSVTVSERPPRRADLVVVDEAPDEMLVPFDQRIPAVKIVHNAYTQASRYVVERCSRFICMTENALERQSVHSRPGQCVLVHQGVDLKRFSPRPRTAPVDRPKVLMHCRMDSGRETTLLQVLDHLDRTGLLVHVVGDGPGFWDVEDRFGNEIILMNHVPNRSVPNLLREMDVVISLGRGAMEAMATGLPVLCAGHGYAGAVTAENIESLLHYNLTGYRAGRDPGRVMDDVSSALAANPQEVRATAERYLSIDSFAERVISSSQPEVPPPAVVPATTGASLRRAGGTRIGTAAGAQPW